MRHQPEPVPSTATFTFVMTEHPSWMRTPAGWSRAVHAADGGLWLACVQGTDLALQPVLHGGCRPIYDVFLLPPEHPVHVAELATAVKGLGAVLRVRNGDLWDALGAAILRQVIRTDQSKHLYRKFCAAHGAPVHMPDGGCHRLFPSWETVLALTDGDFAALGLTFKRRQLRAAASEFGQHGVRWRELEARALLEELQHVPWVGPWTAGAAVADWSNDWQLYPYTDLAVRTWAKRAAPGYSWPDDEARFGDLWRSLAGSNLSELTVLTLAWGSQYGDID